ncbi:unnamed protein product [Rangifer tarandus platyrhynchus]|uniref:Uncharacterized protein n=1 Tax=Rangifer tarandus platyrhynchus TaxID=3082113 RepID=A0AC59ZA57_RANTA
MLASSVPGDEAGQRGPQLEHARHCSLQDVEGFPSAGLGLMPITHISLLCPGCWDQRHAHLPRLLSSVSAIVSCGIPPGNCLDWKTKSEAQGPHQSLRSPTQRGLRSGAQRYEGLTVDPGQYRPPALPPSPLPSAPTAPRPGSAFPGPTTGPVGAPLPAR